MEKTLTHSRTLIIELLTKPAMIPKKERMDEVIAFASPTSYMNMFSTAPIDSPSFIITSIINNEKRKDKKKKTKKQGKGGKEGRKNL